MWIAIKKIGGNGHRSDTEDKHMTPVRSKNWTVGLAAVVTLTLGSMSAAAEPGGMEPVREHRSRDILKHIDDIPDEPSWITRHVSLDLQSGMQYTHSVNLGGRDFKMRLRGPVYDGAMRKRRYGLNLEIRF